MLNVTRLRWLLLAHHLVQSPHLLVQPMLRVSAQRMYQKVALGSLSLSRSFRRCICPS